VLGVHITITTLDEKLARLLEPRARGLNSACRPSRTPFGERLRGRQPQPHHAGITDSDASLEASRAPLGARRHDLGAARFYLPGAAQKVSCRSSIASSPPRRPLPGDLRAQHPPQPAYKSPRERIRRIRERYGWPPRDRVSPRTLGGGEQLELFPLQ